MCVVLRFSSHRYGQPVTVALQLHILGNPFLRYLPLNFFKAITPIQLGIVIDALSNGSIYLPNFTDSFAYLASSSWIASSNNNQKAREILEPVKVESNPTKMESTGFGPHICVVLQIS